MGTKLNPGRYDCLAKAEPDEPYFTLLARDALAPALVGVWALKRTLLILCGLKPKDDEAMVVEAEECAEAMRAWRLRNRPALVGTDRALNTEPLLFNPCTRPPYFAGEETDDDDWDRETGKPGIGLFANALSVWSTMQNRDTTVEEAAVVFNVPVEMVRTAVEWHPWMLLEGKDGNVIGHDGE